MIHENILKTVNAWIRRNGPPEYNEASIRINTLEYDYQGEKIDIDLIWIRSRNRYERIEYIYKNKLMRVEL
jgi:hypothetical protein